MDKIISLLVANWLAIALLALVVALTWSLTARSIFLVALRVLARPLLLAAMIALVYDGTRTLAGGQGLITTSLADHWQNLAPVSYESARAFVGQRLSPGLWDGPILTVLRLPAWLVLGGSGIALSYVGRKRRGVNVFAN